MQVNTEGEAGPKPLREALEKALKSVAVILAIVAALGVGPLPASSLTVSDDIMFLRAVGEREATEKTGDEDAREILWLARAIYSESKREYEQRLVAWVVRNRVESERYPDTYREVVLQRSQFSGLHPTDRQYWLNISREYTHGGMGWDTALSIAEEVYNADASERPISALVTHFYSPVSVRTTPAWARDKAPAYTVEDITGTRFAFYANIE